MTAYNILWDTDGMSPAELDLPNVIKIPSHILEECENECDVVEYISDYITDLTGFCHAGFELDED